MYINLAIIGYKVLLRAGQALPYACSCNQKTSYWIKLDGIRLFIQVCFTHSKPLNIQWSRHVSVIGDNMKYLVIGEYDPEDMDAQFKKAKQYAVDKEMHPDKYPKTSYPVHFMLNKPAIMAVWDTDNEDAIANKIAFMLPEVRYQVIPLVDAKLFMDKYIEINE